MLDRDGLLQRCERDVRRMVDELDAAAIGQAAALHLVWAADLLAIERREDPLIAQS